MSFEDQLRSSMNQVDYSDRDRLMRETARKSVREFRELCQLKARMGEHFCSVMARTREPGSSHLVYFYKDKDYTAAIAKGSPLPHLGEHIFLKLSEADQFLEYVRKQFQFYDMQSARAELVEDISSGIQRGLFGKLSWVSTFNNRYKVMLSMRW